MRESVLPPEKREKIMAIKFYGFTTATSDTKIIIKRKKGYAVLNEIIIQIKASIY